MRMSIKFIIGWMIVSMVAIDFPSDNLCKADSLYAQADLMNAKTRHQPEVLSMPEQDIPLREIEKPEKEGLSRWLWIGLGVIVVGGAVMALGGGGGGGGGGSGDGDESGGGDGSGDVLVAW